MITVSLEGAPQLAEAFQRLGARCADLRPYWPRFETAFYLRELNLFAGEGEGYWVALSPRYAVQKQRVAPGQPLLVLSGTLRESLTDARSPYALLDEQPQTLQIGTSVPHAMIHHTGSTRGLPPRPPIIVDDKLVEEMNFAALVLFGDECVDLGFTTQRK